MDLVALGGPFLAGALLSWSLAAPPGPANAMMAHEAARRSWGAGVRTGLGAVSGDVLMFLLMWVGVLAIVEAFAWTEVALAGAGALLMAFFAWGAWRAARRHARVEARVGSYGRALATVVTSPFNWAWWLTFGAAMFASLGLAVIVGFFAGLVAWVAAWCALARLGAWRFERFAEWVAYGSAAVLAFFAAVAAWFAAWTAWALLG